MTSSTWTSGPGSAETREASSRIQDVANERGQLFEGEGFGQERHVGEQQIHLLVAFQDRQGRVSVAGLQNLVALTARFRIALSSWL